MSWATRIRYSLARSLIKAGGLSVVPQWVQHSFIAPSFASLTREGLKKNAAVHSCVGALAFAFPEPPLLCYDGEGDGAKPLPTHPLRQRLRQPNPIMGERELKAMTITYLALGGNAYWHKVRDRRGQVIELWPYHAGQILPVPGGDTWISRYDFDNGSGQLQPIPADDIMHFKWPTPDPEQPWMALPPIVAAAREVDTDNEATRYLYALLKNDAVPRTALEAPADRFLTPDEMKQMREEFRSRYGGDNRGDVLILQGGTKISRLALNLEELAFDALHKVPEQRICAVLRTPAVVAGLGDDPTFANSENAYVRWTRSTLVPLWEIVASEVAADLGPEFGGVYVQHDLSRVAALQEDVVAKWKRVNTAWSSGNLGWKESRAAIGYGEPDPSDVFLIKGVLMPAAQVLNPQPPQVIDVNPAPDALPRGSNDDAPKSGRQLKDGGRVRADDVLALLNDDEVIAAADALVEAAEAEE